jgi:hypothetical protein
LDANHNGMIDPDEASDPAAKGMLDRIFSRLGKEAHYPMAIQEIVQGYEAAIRAGGSGSARPGGPPAAMAATPPPGPGFGPPPASGGTAPSSPSGTAVASQGLASSPAASPAEAKPTPKKPSRFLRGPERLPKGLPDWFLAIDVHGEGQITMAQYCSADNWSPDVVERFNHYDLNHDGIITAAECLKVEKGAQAGAKDGPLSRAEPKVE